MRRSFLLLVLVPAFFGESILAADLPTQDDEARFLAGLPVQGAPLETLSTSTGWQDHAAELNRAWAELVKRQLAPIASWAPGALGALYTDTTPLLYFFSGPDFLYAHAYFPNATTYILCGIEPVGPLPQVEKIPPGSLGPVLGDLRGSLDSLLDFSFFISKKMRTEIGQNQITGTLPLLYIFLARSGCHIRGVTFDDPSMDRVGQGIGGRTHGPAVKIAFTGPGGQQQTLYYFCTDLSDGPVQKSGFLEWCAGLGPTHAFLKAASYLMHSGGFDAARQFLLGHCPVILQDDSGIPMRYLPPEQWTLRLFGHYSGPIATFKQFPQPELDQLMAAQKPPPLPFSVGYRWHPGQSSLILAVKIEHAKP